MRTYMLVAERVGTRGAVGTMRDWSRLVAGHPRLGVIPVDSVKLQSETYVFGEDARTVTNCRVKNIVKGTGAGSHGDGVCKRFA